MKIERKFTKAGQDAYAGINFVKTTSEIRNPDGTIVFKLDDVEVPDSWSQVASDVIAQKYFRKAGVPTKTVNGQRLILMMSGELRWSISVKPFGRVIQNNTSNYALG